jgi:hypothetical protein
MEIPKTSARSESRNTEAVCADKAVEYGGSAESDCARAMAQAERVLREISLMAFCARRSSPELSSSVREKAESSIPGSEMIGRSHHSYRRQFGGFDLQPIPDQLFLDPGLDFVVHDDGAFELTETGFRRIAQAHSAGLDAVILVDTRHLFRLPPREAKNQRDR